MAIVVEDGTGLSNAQTYIDTTYLAAYALERAIDVSGHDSTAQEAAIVVSAKDWIDGEHTFSGEKYVETQSMEFPRDADGVPAKIKQANASAAILQLQGLLLVDVSTVSLGGQVVSESSGLASLSESTTYKEGTAQVYSRVLPKSLKNLLQPFLSGAAGSLKRW